MTQKDSHPGSSAWGEKEKRSEETYQRKQVRTDKYALKLKRKGNIEARTELQEKLRGRAGEGEGAVAKRRTTCEFNAMRATRGDGLEGCRLCIDEEIGRLDGQVDGRA